MPYKYSNELNVKTFDELLKQTNFKEAMVLPM